MSKKAIQESHLTKISREAGVPIIRLFRPESRDCSRRIADWPTEVCDKMYIEDIQEHLLELAEDKDYYQKRLTKKKMKKIKKINHKVRYYKSLLNKVTNGNN